jgi:hypothetical protein
MDGQPVTRDRGARWARWLAEFVLIVGSVYLAVYLEGVAEDRADQAAARVALSQLLGELRGDAQDFDRIISKQDSLHGDYSDLRRWLADLRSYPADSAGAALYRVTAENSTLFARRSSWTTMVAGSQLADLDAPELVLRLGELYETIYPRIDYNSLAYDQTLSQHISTSRAIMWQTISSKPFVNDASEITALTSSLEYLRVNWNAWYRDLLIQYRADLAGAITAVEEYLERSGSADAAP